MPEISKMRLGKKAPTFHPFTPKLSNLIHPMASSPLPPEPTAVNYTEKIGISNWPMFKNDVIGDCTIASVAHLIQLYTSYTKPSPLIVSQQEIELVYSAVSGWNPNDPSTDNGAVEIDVLNYWANTGICVGDHFDKIAGYARVNPHNPAELRYAVWWFGGLYIGVSMPACWQDTPNDWKMPHNLMGANAPGTWGGHAVPVVAYNEDYLTVVSWGSLVKMDWRSYHTYCDEAWAVISPDFVNQQGVTPAHFDWAYLLAGMQHIREGSVGKVL